MAAKRLMVFYSVQQQQFHHGHGHDPEDAPAFVEFFWQFCQVSHNQTVTSFYSNESLCKPPARRRFPFAPFWSLLGSHLHVFRGRDAANDRDEQGRETAISPQSNIITVIVIVANRHLS